MMRGGEMADVETTRDGAVLTITLNRPDVLNAFTREMHKAFAGTLDEAADTSVRAVVLTGAGRGFCVGQDLHEFREASGDIASHLENNYHPNIRRIRQLEKPVIAAVNGPAAGAGLSLACACDLRIAAEHATLDEQLAYEAKLQAQATQTADFREGVAAFLEKRKARFDGS